MIETMLWQYCHQPYCSQNIQFYLIIWILVSVVVSLYFISIVGHVRYTNISVLFGSAPNGIRACRNLEATKLQYKSGLPFKGIVPRCYSYLLRLLFVDLFYLYFDNLSHSNLCQCDGVVALSLIFARKTSSVSIGAFMCE